jgi:SAM-dependent methyltransferase/uncharacterized protein YbaR (Trm112 family)
MRKWLKEKLLCPECIPEEMPLGLNIEKEHDEDVIEGQLRCSHCGHSYPIHKGIAVILPERSLSILSNSSGYNSKGMLSAYLWAHFCDLFHDPNATDAYRIWSSYFRGTNDYALDIGCAVGRLAFELSKTYSHVIGMDTSKTFIEKARELLIRKRLDFDLIIEGHMTEERSCDFDDQWNVDGMEFIVADALALPFPKRLFSTVTSVNILEKVPDPLQHLIEANRVLREKDSMFVFSDPFTWDESVMDAEYWLGGKTDGKYGGRGMDNIGRLLSGNDGIFDPPLRIVDKRNVSWKIRKTANLWEHINSQSIIATRG